MKTAQEIAQVLLNRRNAMNPVVMQGEMLAALESEGLQEALQRRWLVPDPSTGFLLVSQDQSKVNEMREIAEKCGECPDDKKEKKDEEKKDEWTKPWERPNESHQFAMNHSGRNISELLSPGTGHDSGSPLKAPAAATPTAPPVAATTPDNRPPGMGDEVLVVQKAPGATESQTFTGKVVKNANGTTTVNFGNSQRDYPDKDVTVTKRAGMAGTATA